MRGALFWFPCAKMVLKKADLTGYAEPDCGAVVLYHGSTDILPLAYICAMMQGNETARSRKENQYGSGPERNPGGDGGRERSNGL